MVAGGNSDLATACMRRATKHFWRLPCCIPSLASFLPSNCCQITRCCHASKSHWSSMEAKNGATSKRSIFLSDIPSILGPAVITDPKSSKSLAASWKPKVVVVGAGLAGLTAAKRLHQFQNESTPGQSHFDITVLEATVRIGGRIHSSEIGGEKVELGATWVHGIDESPVYKIASDAGSLHVDRPYEAMDGWSKPSQTRILGGGLVGAEMVKQVLQFYEEVLEEISEWGKEGSGEKGGEISFGAYMRRRFSEKLPEWSSKSLSLFDANAPQEWDAHKLRRAIFDMRFNLERGITAVYSLDDLDLDEFHDYWEFAGEHKSIPQGYSRIPEAIVSALPPGTVRLGCPVTSIQMTAMSAAESPAQSNASEAGSRSAANEAYPIRLEIEGQEAVMADHVIIATSLGVLKAVGLGHKCGPGQTMFDPPLPEWKQGAIRRMGFGVVDKIFVRVVADEEAANLPALRMVMGDGIGDGRRDEVTPLPKHEGGLRDLISEGSSSIGRGSGDLETGNSYSKKMVQAGVPVWMQKTFAVAPAFEGKPILTTWVIGEEALQMERLSEEAVGAGVLSTVRAFGLLGAKRETNERSHVEIGPVDGNTTTHVMPSGVPGGEVVEVLRSTWGLDPYYKGSYSYVAVGSSGKDIQLLATPVPPQAMEGAGAEAAPNEKLEGMGEGNIPRLLFAGEATHYHYYSTTHGAYLTGLREANRLLCLYKLL